MQNKNSPVVESADFDLFGNEIVTPVKGNDGQIYELDSMKKLFAINDEHEYTTIRYHYDSDDERVPNFPNTGFANPLSGFYLSPELCKQLSLDLRHEQMLSHQIIDNIQMMILEDPTILFLCQKICKKGVFYGKNEFSECPLTYNHEKRLQLLLFRTKLPTEWYSVYKY